MPTSRRSFARVSEADEARQAVDPDLTNDLQKHRGRWVALYAGEIVAVADSAREVIRIALENGVTDPTVLRVPSHPERLAFYRRT